MSRDTGAYRQKKGASHRGMRPYPFRRQWAKHEMVSVLAAAAAAAAIFLAGRTAAAAVGTADALLAALLGLNYIPCSKADDCKQNDHSNKICHTVLLL